MKITVFTPTYNRAYTLKRLFSSLLEQTCQDFEWIIIDDGSTDNTEELVGSFFDSFSKGKLIYRKVKNGGKHRAINEGVRMAVGELFYIVDSDDWLPNDALERIIAIEQTIPIHIRCEYAGVCGLKGKDEHTVLGSTFKGDIIDTTHIERHKVGIGGDKAEVYYTSVLKNYPFPEFDGENFIAESTVWNAIAADGLKLRYFNEVVYFCEYLPDGLTAQAEKKIKKNPKGYGLLIQQNIRYNRITGMTKWNEIRNYYRMLKPFCSVAEIARNLGMNPVVLYMRMLGMKLFYKLYR